MKINILFRATLALLIAGAASAATTIHGTDKHACGANIGWLNFEGHLAGGTGAVVGEYIASGFIYSANCGWIDLGDGAPANHVRYLNNSATDYGVNVTNYACIAGVHQVELRGFAYGANIGWIHFEAAGNPRVNLTTGKLRGYAYSANCGWINLGELSANVQVVTTTLRPGADSDGDGLADAFEYDHAGGLATMHAASDGDGDGLLDLGEYQADSDPFDPLDKFRITLFAAGPAANSYHLTFTTKLSRVYQLQANPDLQPANWIDTGGLIKPAGATFTAAVTAPGGARRYFWRAVAKLPLQP